MTDDQISRQLDLEAAADLVALTPDALAGLAAAGYVAVVGGPGEPLTFELPDLKAFAARNADNGSGGRLIAEALAPDGPDDDDDQDAGQDLEPDELVVLLDQRAEQMAMRLLKMYATVFPGAASWGPARQSQFVLQSKSRFEAMLAIAALGEGVDDTLYADLRGIGSAAARRGVKLPQILLMLRISRDLVVQNAIDLAENAERPGGFALSLLLTRILPATDRWSDALTAGYWEAMFPG
jgi:hypothetical protein